MLLEMTAKELMLMGTLVKLAEESYEAERLIKERYSAAFGIGKTTIPVYHTESCGEYYGDATLSVDGKFTYRDNWWGGREYSFSTDAESIFKMLRSCYLLENGMADTDPERFDCNIENIGDYFRQFIASIKGTDATDF